MRYWKHKKILGYPKVGIAVAAHFSGARDQACLQCLVASFQAQTYTNWRMLITHDGPQPQDSVALVMHLHLDPRVSFMDTPERLEKFGHPHRQTAINLLLSDCAWIGLTNQDNYYCPTYLEWLLDQATNHQPQAEFVYCDLVHSHRMWRQMGTQPERGKLDLGAWLAKSTLVRNLAFNNFEFDGDGKYIDKMRKAANGIAKVNATLMVHN